MAPSVASVCFDSVGTLLGVGGDAGFIDSTGVMLGVISYAVVMVCRGRARLVDPALYLLAAMFLLNAALGALA